MKDNQKNTMTPSNDMWLEVERDANGEIVGWEITLKTEDAIKILEQAVHEATKQGDIQKANGAKKLLRSLSDYNIKSNQKQNSKKK